MFNGMAEPTAATTSIAVEAGIEAMWKCHLTYR
jgi:hypothetical protein